MGEVSLRVAVESLLARFHPAVTLEMKLDFLERLSWLVDDNGTELFEIRRAWLSSGNDDLVDLALMPWSVAIAEDREIVEELLAPLKHRREFQGRIEERLAEVAER